MTIFEALRQSHDIQRELCAALLDTRGDSPQRQELFARLTLELAAHAMAEERHFYIPLMQDDLTQTLSRHAIAEHHEMDERVEALRQTEPSSPGWLSQARTLCEKVPTTSTRKSTAFSRWPARCWRRARSSGCPAPI